MRVLLLLAMAAVLAGCAVQRASDNFARSMGDLHGADKDSVLYQMGAPDSSAETSGGEVLTYRAEKRDQLSGYYDYTFKCQVDLRLTDGRVSSVRYRGDSTHPYYQDVDNCARAFGSR